MLIKDLFTQVPVETCFYARYCFAASMLQKGLPLTLNASQVRKGEAPCKQLTAPAKGWQWDLSTNQSIGGKLDGGNTMIMNSSALQMRDLLLMHA